MPSALRPQALAPKKPQTLASYSVLLRHVRLAFAEGRERAAAAVEREKVRTAWESGKLILEHILLNQKRADYGKQVIKRLAGDLRKSDTELEYMVQFARAYPIAPSTGQLYWGHYRELLGINDPKLREKLAKETAKKKWSEKELRSQIKMLKAGNQNSLSKTAAKSASFTAKKGVPYTYRIKKVGEELKIDLGFSNYLELAAAGGGKFAEGDIVRSVKSGAGDKTALPAGGLASDLFTYHARVTAVTDGDTVWVLLDLGFGVSTVQHLRFRGIDAPEIDSRKGRAAKKFIEGILNQSPDVIITSSKSDKYDRYLADVWAGGRFLNQELLDKRLAVRMAG